MGLWELFISGFQDVSIGQSEQNQGASAAQQQQSSNDSAIDPSIYDKMAQKVAEDYEKCLEYINNIKTDAKLIKDDDDTLRHGIWRSTGWWIFTHQTRDCEAEDRVRADRDRLELEKKAIEVELNKLSPEFGKLIAIVNTTLKEISDLTGGQLPYYRRNDANEFQSQISDLMRFLDTIFTIMINRARMVEAQGQFNASSGTGNDFSKVEQLVTASIAQMYQDQSVLSGCNEEFSQEFLEYSERYKTADERHIQWYEKLFTNAEQDKESEMAFTSKVMNVISDIQDVLGSELASFSTIDLMQLINTIRSIVKKIIGVLSDKTLSKEQKQSVVLSILVYLFGQLSLVRQCTAAENAKNNKEMSESIAKTTESGVTHLRAQQEELIKNLEKARIMGIVMTVAQVVIGVALAIAAAATGGVGTAALIGVMTVLQATKVTDKLTAKIAEKTGQVGAEAIMAGSEILLTLGAGKALDAAANRVIGAIMKQVAASTAAVMEAAVKTIAESTARPAVNVAIEGSTMTAQDIAEQAVKVTVQKMFVMEQGFSLILQSVKETLITKMETASKETLKLVQERSQQLIAKSNQEIEQIIASSANEAIAKVLQCETKEVTRFAVEKSGDSFLRKVLDKAKSVATSRYVLAVTFAVASNNLLLELVKFSYEKSPGEKDLPSWVTTMMQVIQALMVMLAECGAYCGGTQVGSGFSSLDPSKLASKILQLIPKIGNGAAILGTGAQAYGQYGQGAALGAQADAVERMGKIQALLDIFNELVQKSVTESAKSDTENALKQEAASTQSLTEMSQNLFQVWGSTARILEVSA